MGSSTDTIIGHARWTNASTGTRRGRLTSMFLNGNDEFFAYEEMTEYLILCPASRKRQVKKRKLKHRDLPLRQSLFSHVAPYVSFQLKKDENLNFPIEFSEHLKWELNANTPTIVRKIVQNSGYNLVHGTQDWCGSWGETMYAFCFKTVKSFQKINHFPGAYEIGHKDRLWKNLNRLMLMYGKKQFGFVPRTYILPHDLDKLRRVWDRNGKKKWILKPPASSRGRGIRVVSRWTQIPRKRSYVVVQQYLSKPKLINGVKFDLRMYVLVTNFNPLKVYLYSEGLVRFACAKYENDCTTLDNQFMHLTNYSINKSCSQYISNDNIDAYKGHKWSLNSLWFYLEKRNVDVPKLLNKITDMIIKTLVSGESSINTFSRVYLSSTYCCFELLGVDILLDENMKPWLLEVNISPSLQTPSPLDVAVKGPLVRDVLNIVGHQIPSKLPNFSMAELASRCDMVAVCQNLRLYEKSLSNREKLKQVEHMHQRNRDKYLESILEDLTPDDVRQLIRYEDEQTQLGQFQKIFPTDGTHKYFRFFKTPRYYNLLLDAWEATYGGNRHEGISRLETLCKRRYHLSRETGKEK